MTPDTAPSEKRLPANRNAVLVSGMLSGLSGLLVFLVVHALWILPIWFILPVGLIVAVPGGLAAGWAYGEVRHRLPSRPWTSFALAALMGITLLPATLLAELRRPMFSLSPAGPVFQMASGEAVFLFVFELLVTATLAAGLLGWWLGRNRRAALAMSVAGFVFALGPGHNIPLIGGTGGAGREWAIMGMVILVSAIVLVEGYARMAAHGYFPGLQEKKPDRRRFHQHLADRHDA